MASYEKFGHNLTFESKLSGQFQRFNAIDGSIEMLKNSSESLLSPDGIVSTQPTTQMPNFDICAKIS